MSKYLKIGLLLTLVWWAQSAFAQDTIPVNTTHAFEATYHPDYAYSWWFVNATNDTTYFVSTTNETEEYLWDVEGNYQLFVQATDKSNCLSEIISKPFVVINKPSDGIVISAGRDTTIGQCNPYQLKATVEHEPGFTYSYLWKPATDLDNPAKANPVFTPGNTTVFKLTVTNNFGFSAVDSVTIAVSDIVANAGNDVFMYRGASVVLDGSTSSGSDIQYKWTTKSGIIESGETTSNPVISGFGTYFLEVKNQFGCVDYDSVNVGMLTYAPVAQDDYDSTRYLTEIKIPVLENDHDPENDIDVLSLAVTVPPLNGTAYVDYNDFTIHYRPNENFSGADNFEYKVCDIFKNCDWASVFVIVSDFKFIVPEAFSPNGDNINDYFEIVGIEYYEGNSIEIFNRWGNKVYQAKNYGISTTPKFWDGKSNTGVRIGNEQLPTGTYFYILNLGNGGKSIAGSVYLDR